MMFVANMFSINAALPASGIGERSGNISELDIKMLLKTALLRPITIKFPKPHFSGLAKDDHLKPVLHSTRLAWFGHCIDSVANDTIMMMVSLNCVNHHTSSAEFLLTSDKLLIEVNNEEQQGKSKLVSVGKIIGVSKTLHTLFVVMEKNVFKQLDERFPFATVKHYCYLNGIRDVAALRHHFRVTTDYVVNALKSTTC